MLFIFNNCKTKHSPTTITRKENQEREVRWVGWLMGWDLQADGRVGLRPSDLAFLALGSAHASARAWLQGSQV